MGCSITPLSTHTGAEVHGIDLSRPVDEAARARLNRAFVDRSVLVFRDQHLTAHQLLAAVGLFGEVFPQHNSRFALPDCPLVQLRKPVTAAALVTGSPRGSTTQRP